MKYRHRPSVVDAIQIGSTSLNDLCDFCGDDGMVLLSDRISVHVATLAGTLVAHPGTWLIRDPTTSELYPCPDVTFRARYEEIPE